MSHWWSTKAGISHRIGREGASFLSVTRNSYELENVQRVLCDVLAVALEKSFGADHEGGSDARPP